MVFRITAFFGSFVLCPVFLKSSFVIFLNKAPIQSAGFCPTMVSRCLFVPGCFFLCFFFFYNLPVLVLLLIRVRVVVPFLSMSRPRTLDQTSFPWLPGLTGDGKVLVSAVFRITTFFVLVLFILFQRFFVSPTGNRLCAAALDPFFENI